MPFALSVKAPSAVNEPLPASSNARVTLTFVSLLLILTGGLVNGCAGVAVLSVVDVECVLLMEGGLAGHARIGMDDKTATSNSRKRPCFAQPFKLFSGSITISNSRETIHQALINWPATV